MAPPQFEQDNISALISQELLQTPYSCSSLTRLSGGTANFVFRGILSQPLPDGTKSIILKHAEDYVALNPTFKLSTTRCLAEETMLNALNDFSPTTEDHISVKAPRLLHFNRETNTQVLEDLPNSLDLKTFFLSPASSSISESSAKSIGRALGIWLGSFHSWTSEPARSDLVSEIEKNQLMQALKYQINYETLIQTIENFPEILEGSRKTFESVRASAAEELERKDGEGFGIIHGDFWSGNVLVPNTPMDQHSQTTLFITDWELCQLGTRALDLGQMIAELYELKHFKDIDAGVWVLQGFVEGYHRLSDEFAFRTAIHVGAHLICWGSRVSGWGTTEQVEDVVRIGKDFVVKGWEKDRGWFEGGVLGCLFTGR